MAYTPIKRLARTRMPLHWGAFEMLAFGHTADTEKPHLAFLNTDPEKQTVPLLRIHSECMTGDVFGSLRCDCGEQLHIAMQRIAREGGLLIYLRQEGRGIGLVNKMRAYQLQDQGLDTAEANVHLGFEVDERSYEDAIAILKDLQIPEIRLLTNNPDKIEAFQHSGIDVIARVPLIIPPTSENEKYLRTKRDLLGHLL